MALARGARSKAISPGFWLLAAFGSEPTHHKQSTSRGTCPGSATNERTMTGTLLAVIARILSGASVRWIDCQPDTCQRVYFANHTSHLDAIVLWSALPTAVRALTRPVAAKDYWEKGPCAATWPARSTPC